MDESFLSRVIEIKSRDKEEALHRVADLFYHREGMRLLRSSALNQVVTKYKAWLPTERLLRSYLPEESLVDIDESNSSLRAVTARGFLETPQRLFMKMVKAAYYRAIFKGCSLDELPELNLVQSPKELQKRGGKPRYVNLKAFLEHWRNPGFGHKDLSEYLVLSRAVPLEDYMVMGWSFGRQNRKREQMEEVSDFFADNVTSLLDRKGESVLDYLVNKEDLPEVVRSRLNLFVESDSIIKEEFCRFLDARGNTDLGSDYIALVSRDERLAAELFRIALSRTGIEYPVLLMRPCFYKFGRLEEVVASQTCHVIEDPGAMLHEDLVLFSGGDVPSWLFDPIYVVPTLKNENVRIVSNTKKAIVDPMLGRETYFYDAEGDVPGE